MKKIAFALVAALVACSPKGAQNDEPVSEKMELVSQDSLTQVTYGEQLEKQIQHFAELDAKNKAMNMDHGYSVMVERLQDLKTRKADSLNVVAAVLYERHYKHTSLTGEVKDSTQYAWLNGEELVGLESPNKEDVSDCGAAFSEYNTIFRQVLMGQ